MRHKKVNFSDLVDSISSFSRYKIDLFDQEDLERKRFLKLLKNIINGELTEKQKSCIMLYYGKNVKMKGISKELNISISSVSKHIKKAKLHIKKNIDYFYAK